MISVLESEKNAVSAQVIEAMEVAVFISIGSHEKYLIGDIKTAGFESRVLA